MTKVIDCPQCGGKAVKGHRKNQCRRCYEDSRKEKCISCGKIRRINNRLNDGNGICSVCYGRQHKEQCSLCGKNAQVSTRRDGKPICSSCGRKSVRPKEKCSVCGGTKPVAVRSDSSAAICYWCYQKSRSECCTVCGEVRVINKKSGGASVCGKCYMKTYIAPDRECVGCGTVSKAEKVIAAGFLCTKCYYDLPEVRIKRLNNSIRYRTRRDSTGEISVQDWLLIMRSTNWTCFYCGESLSSFENRSIDHIIPISRGGKHLVENLVPCCRSCNSSKNDRTIPEWMDASPDMALKIGCDKLGYLFGITSDLSSGVI